MSRKFVEELAGAFVTGHDFSRAAKAQKSCGLQPLLLSLCSPRILEFFREFSGQHPGRPLPIVFGQSAFADRTLANRFTS
jgi:hypothetical protein